MVNRRIFLKKSLFLSLGIVSSSANTVFSREREEGRAMNCEVIDLIIKENNDFQNNPDLPLVHYKAAFDLPNFGAAAEMEKVLVENGWGNNWRNGIYDYHHFHSEAHEYVGVYGGSAEIQFGGASGVILKVEKGDVIIIPAGVAHKRVSSSFGFSVIGAYPPGQSPDMKYGKPEEKLLVKNNIKNVTFPQFDPVQGKNGALIKLWKRT